MIKPEKRVSKLSKKHHGTRHSLSACLIQNVQWDLKVGQPLDYWSPRSSKKFLYSTIPSMRILKIQIANQGSPKKFSFLITLDLSTFRNIVSLEVSQPEACPALLWHRVSLSI